MPQWAGSCWYYLRYLDAQNPDALVSPEAEKTWMNVDLYVGGAGMIWALWIEGWMSQT